MMRSRFSRMIGIAMLVLAVSAVAQTGPMEKIEPFGQQYDPFGDFIGLPKSSEGVEGTYHSQTYVSSKRVGANGEVETEKYAASAVGDWGAKTQEVRQAYANSHSGVERAALERIIDEQAHKVIKERHSRVKEQEKVDVQHDLYKGIKAEQVPEFEKRFAEEAVPKLPHHKGFYERLTDLAGYIKGSAAPASLPEKPAEKAIPEKPVEKPVEMQPKVQTAMPESPLPKPPMPEPPLPEPPLEKGVKVLPEEPLKMAEQ
eukprot:TRINITY_DN4909_c0_g1_i1.p1 TRINITY_DN4909_c0_g1~~TRINITY_DN4909_c0_g1_i1.p1  ORF type:complete len:258 (+),score=68.77 TRINITY_DN4909_c0_g1_i1:87-860(+)